MGIVRGVAFALAVGVACATVPAMAQNTLSANMQGCNASATGKNLTGAVRKAFIIQCMSGGSSTNAAALPSQQQEQRLRVCNLAASRSDYNTVDRQAFMAKCLNGG